MDDNSVIRNASPVILLYWIIGIAAAILFLPFLGHVHLFDWDEINFAECAREMIVSKDYLRMQIDFAPFYEKPPLFIWMQVLSMKVFSVNEYAARFPDALCGIASLLTIFHVGRKTAGRQTGLWWTILYAATWLPHIYFKSGIIDPVFNYFIFLSFYQVWLLKWGKKKALHATLAGLFLGLAVMTKGPAALIISGLSLAVFIIFNKGLKGYKWPYFLLLALVALLVPSIWFGADIAQHGWTFFREFIAYQAGLFGQNIAGHEEPWYYHSLVLLTGCFPASILLFQYGRHRMWERARTRDWNRWMWILFWVVLILFSIVKTKIVHYSSLCYFPLTYLAATRVVRLIEGKEVPKRRVKICLVAMGALWGLVLTGLAVLGNMLDKALVNPAALTPDLFARGNMSAPVSWSWVDCATGVCYLTGIAGCAVLFNRNFRRGLIALCVLQVLAIQVAALRFAPKVEGYSQRSAITWFQGFTGQDVYVHPLGYKSYAHLFYTRKQPPRDTAYFHKVISDVGASAVIEPDEQWLLFGHVDKPVYFICKVSDKADWSWMPSLEQVGEKGGFVFFRRRY